MDFGYNRESISETYKLLAALFITEPDVSLVENFRESFEVQFSATLRDIEHDFADLFYDQVNHLSPCESAYIQLTDSAVGFHDVAEKVYNVYLKEGLLLNEDVNVVPDHIATELLFIGYLVESHKTDSLRKFLKKHAVLWIPQFCDDLYESASTDFYREVAGITKDLILTEYEELSI